MVIYESRAARELVHVDVKNGGDIPGGGGVRARPRPPIRKRSAQKQAKIDYDYMQSESATTPG